MRLIISNTVPSLLPLSSSHPLLTATVLGYGFTSTPKTLLANRRPFVNLTDSDGKIVEANRPKSTDDTLFFHGTLSTGIPLSATLRGGPPFKGTPGMEWQIYGEKGEIRITASGPFLQIGYPDMKVEVQVGEEVEEVAVEGDVFDDLGLPARNVARVYEALARGVNTCSWEDAVERHALLERMERETGGGN